MFNMNGERDKINEIQIFEAQITIQNHSQTIRFITFLDAKIIEKLSPGPRAIL